MNEGVSTMDVGMAVRMGARKTECVLSALRDVGLVRVTITPRPGWVACPPVPDEAKALSDAAWAARGRLRRHAIEANR